MRRRFGCSWMAHITRSGAAYTHDLLSLGSYPKLIRRLTWRSAPRGGGDEDLTNWWYSARIGQAKRIIMRLRYIFLNYIHIGGGGSPPGSRGRCVRGFASPERR